MQAMVIHMDYIIYVFNFIIYVVLCGLLIKQARHDIFAAAKEEKERTAGCPVHRIPKAAIARRTSCLFHIRLEDEYISIPNGK